MKHRRPYLSLEKYHACPANVWLAQVVFLLRYFFTNIRDSYEMSRPQCYYLVIPVTVAIQQVQNYRGTGGGLATSLQRGRMPASSRMYIVKLRAWVSSRILEHLQLLSWLHDSGIESHSFLQHSHCKVGRHFFLSKGFRHTAHREAGRFTRKYTRSLGSSACPSGVLLFSWFVGFARYEK